MRRAAAALVDQRDELERPEASDAARTIVFTGMGGSYDACYPAVNDLAARGVPALLVDAAELLHFRRPIRSTRGPSPSSSASPARAPRSCAS